MENHAVNPSTNGVYSNRPEVRKVWRGAIRIPCLSCIRPRLPAGSAALRTSSAHPGYTPTEGVLRGLIIPPGTRYYAGLICVPRDMVAPVTEHPAFRSVTRSDSRGGKEAAVNNDLR